MASRPRGHCHIKPGTLLLLLLASLGYNLYTCFSSTKRTSATSLWEQRTGQFLAQKQLDDCRQPQAAAPPPPPVAQASISSLLSAPPIPCLGIVVASDPNLFLLRLFHSIDHPVDRMVIVHGGGDPMLDGELHHISQSAPNVTIIDLGTWPGVAVGWNRIIATCGDAVPYYVILNMDVEFSPGSLAVFARSFGADAAQGRSDFGGFRCQVGARMLICMHCTALHCMLHSGKSVWASAMLVSTNCCKHTTSIVIAECRRRNEWLWLHRICYVPAHCRNGGTV